MASETSTTAMAPTPARDQADLLLDGTGTGADYLMPEGRGHLAAQSVLAQTI
jgi:hypothetical protein